MRIEHDLFAIEVPGEWKHAGSTKAVSFLKELGIEEAQVRYRDDRSGGELRFTAAESDDPTESLAESLFAQLKLELEKELGTSLEYDDAIRIPYDEVFSVQCSGLDERAQKVVFAGAAVSMIESGGAFAVMTLIAPYRDDGEIETLVEDAHVAFETLELGRS